MYKLEKVRLEENKESKVPTGHVTEARYCFIFESKNFNYQKIETLEDLKLNWQIILQDENFYHRTSPIAEILEVNEESVTFRTQTSIYKLTKNAE